MTLYKVVKKEVIATYDNYDMANEVCRNQNSNKPYNSEMWFEVVVTEE